jgi:starvation-inducible DNA-binding protein
VKGSYLVDKPQIDQIPVPRVLFQPNIGLGSEIRHLVVKILNSTLADEAVLSMKTCNAHWNARGAGFLELHNLFDIQHRQLNDISDQIAKRTRMLGGIALGSFQEFLKISQLDEQPEESPEIMSLVADHETIIRFLREGAKKCSEEYEDEGTRDLLVDILRLHEKMAWMLRSHIEPALTRYET